MAIVLQHDKHSGITYVYETAHNWGSGIKMPGTKRRLIGRYDYETGKVVPINGQENAAQRKVQKKEITNNAACRNTQKMDTSKTETSKTETQKRICENTNTPRMQTPQNNNLKTLCDKFLEGCQRQKVLAETLRNQLESLGKPLEDLKKHLNEVKTN